MPTINRKYSKKPLLRKNIKRELKTMSASQIKKIIEESVFKKNPIRFLLSKGIDSRIIRSRGFINIVLERYNLNLLRKINYIPKKSELKKIRGFIPFGELKRAGYTINELKKGGFNIVDIYKCGFSLKELHTANYKANSLIKYLKSNPRELYKAGYSIKELKKAGLNLKEIKETGASLYVLLKEGIKFPDLLKIGFSANSINKEISRIQKEQKLLNKK